MIGSWVEFPAAEFRGRTVWCEAKIAAIELTADGKFSMLLACPDGTFAQLGWMDIQNVRLITDAEVKRYKRNARRRAQRALKSK